MTLSNHSTDSFKTLIRN